MGSTLRSLELYLSSWRGCLWVGFRLGFLVIAFSLRGFLDPAADVAEGGQDPKKRSGL